MTPCDVSPFRDYRTNLFPVLGGLGNTCEQWITESLDLPHRNGLGIMFGNVGGRSTEPKSFWNEVRNLFACNGAHNLQVEYMTTIILKFHAKISSNICLESVNCVATILARTGELQKWCDFRPNKRLSVEQLG